jgi:uncharacterized protein (TIGR02246 family)
MKRAMLLATAVAISLSGFGLVSRAEDVGRSGDEDAIRKIVVVMTDAFNRHEAEAATQMYAPDVRFVTVRGEVMDGRPAVEKGLASILGTRAKDASQRTLDVAVRFVRPDVALVHVTNELSGLVTPDGRTLPSHQECSLRVFVKESGVWQVAAFQNTLVRPFNAP